MAIRPAQVRAIRAYLGDTQEQFGKRFSKDRYTVIYWEKYGIADQPALERLMRALKGPPDESPGTKSAARK